MMTGRCMYRVEDEYSQARTTTGKGVVAADVKSWVDFRARQNYKRTQLTRHFRNHINWSNRTKTPFISTYDDYQTAYEEALRRKRRGRKNVTIIIIDIGRAGHRVEYRNVRRLAETLECWIPNRAWNNSEFEYIFLHRIPARAVIDVIKL